MKINLQDEMSGRAIKSVSRVAFAFLALGIAVAPSMFAEPKEKKTAVSNLGVVAHVQLDGGSATHMVLMQKNVRNTSTWGSRRQLAFAFLTLRHQRPRASSKDLPELAERRRLTSSLLGTRWR
jgi:hypothetical protein